MHEQWHEVKVDTEEERERFNKDPSHDQEGESTLSSKDVGE